MFVSVFYFYIRKDLCEVRTPTVQVVIGTGGLIDGHCVVYGEDLEATWMAQSFQLRNNGSFQLDLKCDYLSENPKQSKIHRSGTQEVDLDYMGSTVLLQVWDAYEIKGFGDFIHGRLTEVIPLIPKSTDSKMCFVEYEGNFSTMVNVTKVMTQAYGIEVKLSWIRVFEDKNDGTLYYQWLQGRPNIWRGKKLDIDKLHHNVSGGFSVYYPIPRNVTLPLLDYTLDKFDYVTWIEENIL